MVIVAGHVMVDPEQREAYLAASVKIVEKAREADGCLDFAMTADPIDPGRLNLFERWESQAAVKAFRRRAPRHKHAAAILSGSVAEYDVADVRHLFGERGA
jgi:quinol monooxygenase YgiN